MGSSGVSGGDGDEDRRGMICDTPGVSRRPLPTERGVTSTMLMESGG
jgi:hypothetical protein